MFAPPATIGADWVDALVKGHVKSGVDPGGYRVYRMSAFSILLRSRRVSVVPSRENRCHELIFGFEMPVEGTGAQLAPLQHLGDVETSHALLAENSEAAPTIARRTSGSGLSLSRRRVTCGARVIGGRVVGGEIFGKLARTRSGVRP